MYWTYRVSQITLIILQSIKVSNSNPRKADLNWLRLPLNTFLSRNCSLANLCNLSLKGLREVLNLHLNSLFSVFIHHPLCFYQWAVATSSWYRVSLSWIRSYFFFFFKARKYECNNFSYFFLTSWTQEHMSILWEILNLRGARLRLTSVPTTLGLLAVCSEILSWLCLPQFVSATVVRWRKHIPKHTHRHTYTVCIVRLWSFS